MNSVDNGKLSNRKSVLLAFENKRICDFQGIQSACSEYLSCGYFFDKISRVSFDNSEEIVRAIKDGVASYENVFLYYPARMDDTVKQFVCELLKAKFDGLGILSSGKVSVFALFSDKENRLRFSDIKAVLDKKYGKKYDRAVIRTVGVPKKLFENALLNAQKLLFTAKSGNDASINVNNNYGDCRIEIVYSDTTPKMTVDGAVREIVKSLNDYVYAMEDISLTEQLFRLLKLRRMKISVAESFTGGGICKRLVDVSGISEVFFEGLNTYSNEAKSQRLGVSEYTLQQHGAVSAETAKEMAEGLLKTGNCDIAVATTGIAGPKSDNTKKPVGLAYIAVGSANRGVLVYKYNFVGDRKSITQTAINQALFLAYKELK